MAPGLDRAPGAGRRAAAAVRDGAARRRPLGDELLHRPGRGAGGRGRQPADRPAAGGRTASPARWSPTTSRWRSCAPCTGWPATRPRPPGWPCGRASTWNCRRWTATASRCARRRVRRHRHRRWWTGRSRRVLQPEVRAGPAGPGLARRSPDAGRHRTADPGRRAGVPLAGRGRWPAGPSCLLAQRGRAAARRRAAGRGGRAAGRRRPARCSAATRSPGTSACITLACRWASRSRPCWTRCALTRPGTRSATRRAARYWAATTPASPPRPRWRPTPTSASRYSATSPGCSGGAPPARAATRPTCGCPAARRSCWRRCWPPARRWCWCCWSGAPTS